MKTCPRCGKRKRLTSFYRKGADGRQSYCRKCNNESRAAYYQENKARYKLNKQRLKSKLADEINALKANTPCADCRKRFPPVAMDFDHLEGSTKSGNVSTLIHTLQSRVVVMREIEKCEIVCANCHRVRTHSRIKTT